MPAPRNIAEAWSVPEIDDMHPPLIGQRENERAANRTDLPIPNLLVVDDDPVICELLERLYLQSGYSVVTATTAEEGLRRLAGEDVDFVITDIKLPGMDGVQFISCIHQSHPDLPVIAITGYADIQIAVDVLKLGASDFVTKPFDSAAVLESTRAALESTKVSMEVRHLRRWLKERFQFAEMISQTPEMHHVFELIRIAAPTDMTVLIHGETGTGKELVANAIHFHSGRRRGPFVAINCAGFPENLLESELFGYEKGAFTGADEGKQGKIALADGGTLFLDEIESMSLSMQAKLLRVLEDRKVRRLGGSHSMHIDMRVIAASNIVLKDMVAQGKMRSDFYYRINVVPIHLIPLRKRSVDIPLLVQNFLHQHPVARSKKIVDVSKKVMGQLVDYSWPGNVRELQNTLECAILLAPGRIIEEVKLPQMEPNIDLEKSKIASATLRQWLREKEKDYLAQKLADLGGNIGLTAKMCRIGVRTLSRKMRLYGLDKNRFKDVIVSNEPLGPNGDRSVSGLSNDGD
jgi:DNA-binding NtrC family response regulator